MTRMLLATAGALVLASGAAWAERSPESWQDCAGKPWVTGDKMETPMRERWWPNPLWGESDEAMEAGEEITMAHVKAALEKQGMADFQFAEGDAVLFRTGWSKYWKTANEKFNSGAPGIGMEIARWLSDDVKAGLWGSDQWASEGVPNPDPGCAFCVHAHLLTRNGIVNQENMNLEELAADGVYTFLYVYSPVPIGGATGSAGSPVAID